MLDEHPSLPFPHTGREKSCGRSSLTRYGALIIVSLDAHPPTPADWSDEMSLSASEIEKAKSRTKPETPKHYTEEVLP